MLKREVVSAIPKLGYLTVVPMRSGTFAEISGSILCGFIHLPGVDVRLLTITCTD
jgi:hypothetical protein